MDAAFPLCAWWTFRDRVVAQLVFVIAALVAFIAPIAIGLAKYRRITSYHTRLAKLVAIVMVSALQVARAAKTAPLLALALLGLAGAARAQLPDLVPEVSDVTVEWSATVDAGDVAEGCAASTTGRDLVRLSLTTRNDGPGAESLRDPLCPVCATHPNEVCGNPDFICSPAGGHDHPHYRNFLRYEIVDPHGVIAAVGGKRSFCLEEWDCDPGYRGGHTCSNQGIDPHCWDTYPYYLGCQYVDVTDVPDGDYALRVTVDPLQQIDEEDETNNVVEQPVAIIRGPLADAPLEGGALFLKAADLLRMRADSPKKLDLHGGKGDPTLFGATLYVSDIASGETIGFALPAGGWKRIGKATDPRAYRYRGDGSSGDPCRSASVSRGGLLLRCSLKGEHVAFSLPAKGKIFVQLLLGSGERRLCASFGGATVRNDAVLVKRRDAPPTNCDTGD